MRANFGTLLGPGTRVRVATMSADVTNSTLVLADVTGLTFPVEVGTYNFEFNIVYFTAALTTGVLLSINGPAGSYLRFVTDIKTTASASTFAVQTAYNAGSPTTASQGSGKMPARVYGSATFTAAGTLALRFRSEVDTSLVTIEAGSFGVLYGG